MTPEEIQKELAIQQQEKYGRDICVSVLKRLIQPPYTITEEKGLGKYDPVDLELTATNMDCLLYEHKILVEVKCRNKNAR